MIVPPDSGGNLDVPMLNPDNPLDGIPSPPMPPPPIHLSLHIPTCMINGLVHLQLHHQIQVITRMYACPA